VAPKLATETVNDVSASSGISSLPYHAVQSFLV